MTAPSYGGSPPAGFTAAPNGPGAPSPPATVRAVFALMLAGVGLTVVSDAVLLTTHSLRSIFTQAFAQVGASNGASDGAPLVISPHTMTVLVEWVTAGIIAITAGSITLTILLAFKIRRGRRWAWIVQLVLSSGGLLSFLSAFTTAHRYHLGIAESVVGPLAYLLNVAVFVLLVVRPTREFVLSRTTGPRPYPGDYPPFGGYGGPGYGSAPHPGQGSRERSPGRQPSTPPNHGGV